MRLENAWLCRRLSVLAVALIVGALSTQSLAQTDDRSVPDHSRDGYGQSHPSFWSPLTAFEQDTLAQYPLAEQGDPDALLALYLVASGDVRSRDTFEQLRQSMMARLPPLQQRLQARQMGEYLLDVMFQHYFTDGGQGAGSLAAYDAQQSQLSTLLGSGRYNCISSSLLYIVLARQAGLEADGVILPSHAFVEITLPDGGRLSVETTSPDGFGVEHDRAWFEGADEQWFQERDLDVPRFEDYQSRQRVSAAQLGLENMWNQHAARLPYVDRLRLAELQAHLRPDDLMAQMNRMIYYSREIEWMLAQEDADTLQRFMQQTAPWRDRLSTLLQQGHEQVDSAFLGLWYWLEVQRASALVAGGQSGEGLDRALRVLQALTPDIPDGPAIRHNAHVVLDEHVRLLSDESGLERTRRKLSSVPMLCGDTALCQQALARLHTGLATLDWERGNWAEAIGHFREYLDTPGSDAFRGPMEQNMEGAWLNWAEQNWYDEFRDQAIERLRRCVSALEQAPRCQQRLQEYQARQF